MSIAVLPDLRLDMGQLDHRISELPSLPSVVLELLEVTGNASSTLDELVHKIQQDPVMTARILRLANSSFYGMAGRIALLSEAVTILGLRVVRSVALSVGLMCALPVRLHQHHQTFWRHTLGTALCARALAPRFEVDEDQAFMAGLLHDLGRVGLMGCFPEHYAAVLAHQQAHDSPPLEAERAVLGIDHQQAGALLAKCWHFPVSMAQMMSCHHLGEALNPSMPLVALTHLADNVVHALGLSGDEEESVPPLDLHVWAMCPLGTQAAQELFERVEAEWSAVAPALFD